MRSTIARYTGGTPILTINNVMYKFFTISKKRFNNSPYEIYVWNENGGVDLEVSEDNIIFDETTILVNAEVSMHFRKMGG